MQKLNQKGQTLSEYLILLMLIALTSLVATSSLGKRIKEKIEMAERHVSKDIVINDGR